MLVSIAIMLTTFLAVRVRVIVVWLGGVMWENPKRVQKAIARFPTEPIVEQPPPRAVAVNPKLQTSPIAQFRHRQPGPSRCCLAVGSQRQ